MKQPPAHSWVEVSERALIHNIRAHRAVIGPRVKLMAVVKSNAYGHGIELVSRVAQKSKQVDWLGVASLAEARLVRAAKVTLPILALSHYRPFVVSEIAWGIRNRVSFVLYGLDQLKVLEAAAKKAKQPARVHLKIDTGMARLGLRTSAARALLQRIAESKYLKLEGVFSHFATAEDTNQTFFKHQLREFESFLKTAKISSQVLQHIACSAAITAAPRAHHSLVRLGIALYGLWPSLENQKLVQRLHPRFTLQPALTWETQIIEVQQLPKGTPVGYGRSYMTKRQVTMAIIPVGYWDGYDRKLSNIGSVIIHGTRAPIIGRICMNIAMVDASAVKGVKPGDEVVLIGQQGSGEVTADEVAQQVDTINYEVVTRINPLLPRILL